MYFKLAFHNVLKSFKDYMIYFLTLAFSVCLFYSFNSFQAQQAVMEMSAVQYELVDNIQTLMNILSILVAFILAFLILYANNFLIKRRKKELGLYTLLGMQKRLISRILVYETFIIGLLSLLAGLGAGLLLSQLLSVFTANLFEVILNYHFIFSMDATIMTMLAFALIFFIIMIFNTFSLNRYKLIDLLTADKKTEALRIKHLWVSILLFFISISLLAFTYWYAIDSGYEALLKLNIIAPAGILGTLLFFMSLSGFLLKFVQSSKKLYYRKLNIFVLRQINASINSNFISMSIVCIMLLFSIGALSTGTNLNRTINQSIQATTPYDYTYVSNYRDGENAYDISSITEDLQIDTSQIKEASFVHDYHSDISMEQFKSYLVGNLFTDDTYAGSFEVLPLSEYNRLREVYGYEPISLKKEEAYFFTSYDITKDALVTMLQQDISFPLYGQEIQIINKDFPLINLGTTIDINTFIFGVVVQDEIIPENTPLRAMYWNVQLQDDVDQALFYQNIEESIRSYMDEIRIEEGVYQENKTTYWLANSTSAQFVRENSKGLSVVMTYIGLYLGIVFLIASAVILALQQLSQASDNKQRYQILHKIGAEKRMISQSIFLQLSIYFFMPLILAILHSIVGIQVVNLIVQIFGSSDIFLSSLITGGILLLIYGVYFLITYIGYKNILYKD